MTGVRQFPRMFTPSGSHSGSIRAHPDMLQTASQSPYRMRTATAISAARLDIVIALSFTAHNVLLLTLRRCVRPSFCFLALPLWSLAKIFSHATAQRRNVKAVVRRITFQIESLVALALGLGFSSPYPVLEHYRNGLNASLKRTE